MKTVTLESAREALDHLSQHNGPGRLNEALALLVPGKSVSAEAAELLRIWKTWLGSSRDACDDAGKQLWDRIEAVLATCG